MHYNIIIKQYTGISHYLYTNVTCMIGVDWELNAMLIEPRPLEGCGRNTLSLLSSSGV